MTEQAKIIKLPLYGLGIHELKTRVPRELLKNARKKSAKTIFKQLTLTEKLRFFFLVNRQRKSLMKIPLKKAYSYGLDNREFVKSRVQAAAMFKTLMELKGRQEAEKIMRDFCDLMAKEFMSSVFPTAEELAECGDSFTAFKEYMKAGNGRNHECGLHQLKFT